MQVTFTFDHNDPAAWHVWQGLFNPALTPCPNLAPSLHPAAPAEDPAMTPAQARAAKARAAKTAKAAQPEPAADAEDVSGPAPNGAETEEDFGLTQPSSMSPGEAHEAALALVRDIF